MTPPPCLSCQVAGITFAYDARRPPGSRVLHESVQLAGAPLDLTRRYKVGGGGGGGAWDALHGMRRMETGRNGSHLDRLQLSKTCADRATLS
jgi:hypothetical protein